jgi:hypothetical protein
MGGAQSNLKNTMVSNLEKIQKDIEGFQNESTNSSNTNNESTNLSDTKETKKSSNYKIDNNILIILIICGLLFLASRNQDLIRKYINF